jgi:putative oxidoreductase
VAWLPPPPNWALAATATAGAFLLFVYKGAGKLLRREGEVTAWENWGFPDWLMGVVAGVELLGALMLIVGRTRTLGALALLALMPVAALTHIAHGEWHLLPLPLVAGLLLLIVLWTHPPRVILERLGKSRGPGGPE